MADILWKTLTLPNAVVGEPYEAALGHNAAASAITACAVTTGALPPGITINADFVRLTGTPTKAGTFTFTLTLTDTAGGVVSGSLSIVCDYAVLAADRFLANTPVAAQVAKLWH